MSGAEDHARLFLGLELNDEARCALSGVRAELERRGIQGKLYAADLYHLTLCFLGTTERDAIPRLQALMEGVTAQPFSLTLAGLDTFKGGSILWAGVQASPALTAYQARLAQTLRAGGFPPVEEAVYTPHITLGRQMKSAIPAGILVPEVAFPVRYATLFESTRVDGRLTYVPLGRGDWTRR